MYGRICHICCRQTVLTLENEFYVKTEKNYFLKIIFINNTNQESYKNNKNINRDKSSAVTGSKVKYILETVEKLQPCNTYYLVIHRKSQVLATYKRT